MKSVADPVSSIISFAKVFAKAFVEMTSQEWQSRILLLMNFNNIYSRGFHDKEDFGNMKQQQWLWRPRQEQEQQGHSLEEVLCSWSEHQLLVDLQVQLWPLRLQLPPACCCPRIRTLKWQLVKQYDSIDMSGWGFVEPWLSWAWK